MRNANAQRLTTKDWIDAGFAALSTGGHDFLKAEPLARRIGTTKGSFYWHFKDVPTYHQILLEDWESRLATPPPNSGTNPVSQLRSFVQSLVEQSARLDAAIRAWGAASPLVQASLMRVDEGRLMYLQSLLSQIGVTNPEMARIIYAAAIGMTSLPARGTATDQDAIGSLVDLVLALR
ncbi:TetR/AcrR family transcriptional regulator [Roseovarius sp. EL26]|uniref:TetR/AcrR family transcriptional regulator n=1 Tax=Roseovarius sp. EL26 TaxID=2126672 RepID=UPI000EA09168|nr:TetR/AcrR family transcriptional regulator [Roseovarius sp. EL26]